MKKQMILFILTGILVNSACIAGNYMPQEQQPKIVTKGIRFCESTYPYEGGAVDSQFRSRTTESAK